MTTARASLAPFPPPKCNRRQYIQRFVAAVAAALLPSQSVSARGLRPGSASDALPNKYPPDLPFAKQDFSRFDETDDALFYTSPRLVAHIDNACVAALRAFCSQRIKTGDRVLDLCAAYVSYLPRDVKAIGVGMNMEEMQANNSLQEQIIGDLNRNPKLPFEDHLFDVVLCALSIDYLTRPVDVLREAGRVLQPGGVLIVAFSDRVFAEKAVSSWTATADEDHIYAVASFIHFSQMFANPSVSDISPRNVRGALLGDPLFVVEARSVCT